MVSGPTSSHSRALFPRPTPCSPVHVPDIARARLRETSAPHNHAVVHLSRGRTWGLNDWLPGGSVSRWTTWPVSLRRGGPSAAPLDQWGPWPWDSGSSHHPHDRQWDLKTQFLTNQHSFMAPTCNIVFEAPPFLLLCCYQC